MTAKMMTAQNFKILTLDTQIKQHKAQFSLDSPYKYSSNKTLKTSEHTQSPK